MNLRLELRPAVSDQEIADRPLAGIGLRTPCPLCRESKGDRSDVLLLATASSRQVLDFTTAEVAGAEVHLEMHATGIPAKDCFRGTERLDEVSPVNPDQLSKAGDAMADGGMIRCLVMAFGLLDQIQGLPVFRQLLFDPVDHQSHGGMRSLQAGRQLRQERGGH